MSTILTLNISVLIQKGIMTALDLLSMACVRLCFKIIYSYMKLFPCPQNLEHNSLRTHGYTFLTLIEEETSHPRGLEVC